MNFQGTHSNRSNSFAAESDLQQQEGSVSQSPLGKEACHGLTFPGDSRPPGLQELAHKHRTLSVGAPGPPGLTPVAGVGGGQRDGTSPLCCDLGGLRGLRTEHRGPIKPACKIALGSAVSSRHPLHYGTCQLSEAEAGWGRHARGLRGSCQKENGLILGIQSRALGHGDSNKGRLLPPVQA